MDTGSEVTGPMNIGNPHEISIRALAEAIVTKIGGPAKLVERPLPADDPFQRQPDIAEAQRALGWSPRIELDEGLDRTIEYFREKLRA